MGQITAAPGAEGAGSLIRTPVNLLRNVIFHKFTVYSFSSSDEGPRQNAASRSHAGGVLLERLLRCSSMRLERPGPAIPRSSGSRGQTRVLRLQGSALTGTRATCSAGSLRGARVLVTGASTGIGEQLAYCYARLGAQVVITARRENVLQQVSVLAARRVGVKRSSQVRPRSRAVSGDSPAPGGPALGAQKALYVTGDMATTSDPSRVVKFAVDELGGLDYLVLNHIGRYSFSPWSGDVHHVRGLMEVNFLSYVQLASAALPSLEKSKGSIVVVSSLLGEFPPTPFTAPYTATKFAVNGFFCTLQHELAMRSSDVSLTISILGLVDTESAMEKVSGRTRVVPYPAGEAALHVVRAGSLRQKESFYPWYTHLVCLVRDWCPFFRDVIIRNSYY
ncbi:hydroxysteroid 11-beta-dehydrogenase 1-like protein-like [Scleropages formosus]|uniref:Hydroxysteroid 11-beta-dehydrogenase 1-like protein-like n=1 Tax=Scleropages formosus TaxID=113540 RepID=A0A0N8JXU2_SCLFO|nr:hydroxysteroid 11-beta-dehydrogenase 1-like protein-like [Scleropages formosus]